MTETNSSVAQGKNLHLARLKQAIEIWDGVCERWRQRERMQLALGAEFWEPAGPEIAANGMIADKVMAHLADALENNDTEQVKVLVGEILDGSHYLMT